MSHSCVEVYVHLIFATKDRLPFIPEKLEPQLYRYFITLAQDRKSPILTLNGVSDHVHISLKLHPAIALSTLVKELKSYSSGWMKRQGVKAFTWQEGYGAFSASKSHLDGLGSYIGNQKQHHRKYSFSEELAVLSKKYGVTWTFESNGPPKSP